MSLRQTDKVSRFHSLIVKRWYQEYKEANSTGTEIELAKFKEICNALKGVIPMYYENIKFYKPT